jgi:hypothetical protein
VPRQLEGDESDAPNLVAAINFGVEGLRLLEAARRTEIDAAEQFADDDQVNASNGLTTEGRAIDQTLIDRNRAKICVIAKKLAKVEKTVLAFFSGRQVIVFGIAHGTEENSVALQTEFSCGLGKRLAVTFDSDAADISIDEFEFVVVLACNDL